MRVSLESTLQNHVGGLFPSFPPSFLSAATTTTTTNAPLGGSLAAFPPFFTAAPLSLLLQKELAAECQCQ